MPKGVEHVLAALHTKAQLKVWERSVGIQPGDPIRVGPGEYRYVR
jgi:hypothetical protein